MNELTAEQFVELFFFSSLKGEEKIGDKNYWTATLPTNFDIIFEKLLEVHRQKGDMDKFIAKTKFWYNDDTTKTPVIRFNKFIFRYCLETLKKKHNFNYNYNPLDNSIDATLESSIIENIQKSYANVFPEMLEFVVEFSELYEELAQKEEEEYSELAAKKMR